jgi:hypothetical protein
MLEGQSCWLKSATSEPAVPGPGRVYSFVLYLQDDTLVLGKLNSRRRRRLLAGSSFDKLAAYADNVVSQLQQQQCSFQNVCAQGVVSGEWPETAEMND